jgi:predicted dehydrogenase
MGGDVAWSRARVSKRTTKRHRISVIGLGAMGRRHARVLAALAGRFDLVGAYDIRPDLEMPAGVPRLGSELEAIARADVVVVATPNGAHAATVAAALRAGRDVLVEKPLCSSSAESEALVAAAGAARLFVGHSERFNPVVRVLARLLRGDPLLGVDLRRVGPSAPSSPGALLNLGVHDFDLAAYLAGTPLAIRGAVGRRGDTEFGEEEAHVVFSTPSGAVGHLHVDRTAPERRRMLSLATRRWIYEGDLLNHRLVRVPRLARAGGTTGTTAPTGGVTEVPLPLEEPLLAQAAALADALDGAPAREIATGHDGAVAVALAEQAATMCVGAPGSEARSALRRTPG